MRVPATSANLGPGFDSFGLALARYDEVTRQPARRRACWSRSTGVGADEVPLTDEHLVVRAMARAFAAVGRAIAGSAPEVRELHPARRRTRLVRVGDRRRPAARPGTACADRRPPAVRRRGARAWRTRWRATPTTLPPPCSAGSRWPILDDDGRPVAVRREVHPDIRVVVFSAHQASSTHHTRGLLPATVPHADASRERGRRRPAGARADRRPGLPVAGHPRPAAPGLPGAGHAGVGAAGRRPARGGDRGGDLRCRAVGDRAGHRFDSDRRTRWRRDRVSRSPRSRCVRLRGAKFTLADRRDTLDRQLLRPMMCGYC